jgi:hypothetical protein
VTTLGPTGLGLTRLGLAGRVARRAFAAGCACAGRGWTAAFRRDLGGVSFRAEISSR